MEEKRHVYVSTQLADKIEHAQSEEARLEEVTEYIASIRRSEFINFESLDDDILQLKAYALKSKKLFKDTKEELFKEGYSLWEEYDKEVRVLENKFKEIGELLNPLQNQVQELQEDLNGLQTYTATRTIEDLEKLTSLLGNKEIREYLKYALDKNTNS